MSDQIVSAKDILQALMEVRRSGRDRLLQELEQREPELTEFLLERNSLVNRQMLNLGTSVKMGRRLLAEIETTQLVLLTALQNAQKRLWEDQVEGTRLAELDPTISPSEQETNSPPVDSDPPDPPTA